MGWRKWTILDGDLPGALQRASAAEEGRRTPTLPVGGGSFNAAASQSGWSGRILSVTGRASGRAVTARWLCSDSRGFQGNQDDTL